MSPNEKVSLAFMGTGTRGLQLALEASRDPAVHISYLCDVDDRALESGAARISKRVKQAFTCISDFRMALDDPYVDALVVAAPDHWHFAAASMACAAGKHVYLEKPGCHNCEEAILLPKVAKRYSRLVQLGTQRRSDPRFADAIGKLRQGAIGSVRNARAWFNVKRPSIGYGNLTKAPDRFNYDLWQGPAPRKQYRDNLVPHNWHRFWHWGSGELGNNGVHLIDVCRWGLNVNFPKSVTSAGGKYLSVDDQETPDTHFAHFDFAGKSVAWEYRNDRPNLWRIIFHGDHGRLQIGNHGYSIFDENGKRVYHASGLITRAKSFLMTKTLSDYRFNHGTRSHLGNFVQAVRTGERLNAGVEDGYKSALLCHLGNISLRTGQTISCDPRTGQIIGNAKAKRLWQRDYDKRWMRQFMTDSIEPSVEYSPSFSNYQ